jgi:hypothetical protein
MPAWIKALDHCCRWGYIETLTRLSMVVKEGSYKQIMRRGNPIRNNTL